MGGPEGIGFYGLGYAIGGYASVGPGDGAVAITDGPVALLSHISTYSMLN